MGSPPPSGKQGGGLPQGCGLDRLRMLTLRTPYRLGIAVGERAQPSCGRTGDSMPRQRIHHSRVTYQVPHDFPERLERFKEESGLSWAEIARRLDVHHETLRRWRKGRARPSMRNMMALVALARPLGLAHLFTD